MKSWIPILAGLLVAGALLVQQRPHITPRVVHADGGCDATSLNAAYGYSISGFFYDNLGNLNTYNSVGRVVADGQGNITGKDTASTDGSTTSGETLTGTYTVNSDCTGSLTINSPSSGNLKLDFVTTNNGNELQLIVTNGGANLAGSAKKQSIASSMASGN
jgi:hypothetical protein